MNEKIPKLLELKKSKIRAEINEKETKERITVKINKTKSKFFEKIKKKKNWQAFSQTHQGKKREREESNQQNY